MLDETRVKDAELAQICGAEQAGVEEVVGRNFGGIDAFHAFSVEVEHERPRGGSQGGLGVDRLGHWMTNSEK